MLLLIPYNLTVQMIDRSANNPKGTIQKQNSNSSFSPACEERNRANHYNIIANEALPPHLNLQIEQRRSSKM